MDTDALLSASLAAARDAAARTADSAEASGEGETKGAEATAESKGDDSAPVDTSPVEPSLAKQVASSRVLEEPADDVQLKEFGLSVLQFIIESLSDEETSGEDYTAAIAEVADLICGLPFKSLFDDWAPPRSAHEQLLEIDGANCGSDTADATHPAEHAASSGGGYWSSVADATRKSSKWFASLGGEQLVTAVELKWQTDSSAKGIMPKSYQVQLCVGEDTNRPGAWETVASVEVKSAKEKDVIQRKFNLGGGVSVRHIRILSEGYAAGNTVSQHQLNLVKVYVRDDDHVHTSMLATLRALQQFLQKPAMQTANAEAHAHALRGLMGLMQASGSLNSVLAVVRALVAAPGDALPEPVQKYGAKMLDEFGLLVDEQIEAGLSANGEALNQRQTATFDAECKSGGIELCDGNMKLRSNSTSNMHCYVNVGFATGKAAWTFRSERDSNNDECLCFGCGTKPANNSNYDSSPNLWMIRCYSGNVHNGGSSAGSVQKIHQGDVVRFELDHGLHQVEAFVNGTSLGVVFRDLPEQEIFPAVCTYGSNREAVLVSVEGEAEFVEGATVLSDLEPNFTENSFHNEGKIGEDVFAVDGTSSRLNLAMLPSTSEPVSVVYDIGSHPQECFVGFVGVTDASPVSALPAVLQVVCDETVVWTSPPMSEPGSKRFFRVFINDVSQLELRCKVAKATDSTDEVAQIALLTPRVMPPRDWSWAPHGMANTTIDDASALASPIAFVDTTLNIVASLAALQRRKADSDGSALEAPFCLEVDAATFEQMSGIMQTITAQLATSDDAAKGRVTHVLERVLQLLRLNLGTLATSGVDPQAVGVHLEAREGRRRTLEDIHDKLQSLMAADSAFPKAVQEAAAAVVDSGLTLLYPTDEERQALLTSLISGGGVVEVQFKFPTLKVLSEAESKRREESNDDSDITDMRYERALLMLQVECEAMGWRCQLEGKWEAYSHLVIDIPDTDASAATRFLDSGFARVMKKAGFPEWTFPAGCAEPNISLVIQRFMNFSLSERTFEAAGVGFVRLYPKRAGGFDDVCKGIAGFLEKVTESSAAAAASSTE